MCRVARLAPGGDAADAPAAKKKRLRGKVCRLQFLPVVVVLFVALSPFVVVCRLFAWVLQLRGRCSLSPCATSPHTNFYNHGFATLTTNKTQTATCCPLKKPPAKSTCPGPLSR